MVRGSYRDRVVVALEMEPGLKDIEVGEIFQEGETVYDYYSGKEANVDQGRVQIESDLGMVLLGISRNMLPD
jgi:alpha-amylase